MTTIAAVIAEPRRRGHPSWRAAPARTAGALGKPLAKESHVYRDDEYRPDDRDPARRPAGCDRRLAATTWLTVLATIAVVFALDWAQGFVISMLLGVLFAYTLNPLVAWLERIRLPRLAGTTLVMLSVVGTLVIGTYSLRGQIETIFDQLPEAAQKISARMTRLGKGQGNTMQTVQSVANVIEKAAQASMVIFLTFFLLLGGKDYKQHRHFRRHLRRHLDDRPDSASNGGARAPPPNTNH